MLSAQVMAQELEPRRWSHLPVGVNFAAVGYAYTEGNIFLDPALLIEDAEAKVHSLGLGYTSTFGLLGKLARIDLLVNVSDGRWSGLVDGEPASTRRQGFGDPRVRFAVNLLGSPAQGMAEFRQFIPGMIVGASLEIRMPFGEYEEERLINLGTNRWTFRPQLGVVQEFGRWTAELTGSAWFFTDNDEYRGDNKLELDPLYALQAHLIYTFRPGLWASLSTAFGSGARPILNGIATDNEQENVLWALSVGLPIDRRQGVKIAYQRGEATGDIGLDYERLILAYSLMWGGS